MMRFHFRALESDGGILEGEIEAIGRRQAYDLLEERNLDAVDLSENVAQDGEAAGVSSLLSWKSVKVPFRALESFTRQLAGLLAAGVPLSRALSLLHREAANPAARETWKGIHDLVIDGAPLADAMARYPETFPRVYTAMVQAGETGGFLDVVLEQIADFQNREKEVRSRLIAALIYPAILLCLAAGVVVFLMLFFIPRFKTIFAGFGASLPILTRVIVATSEFLRDYGGFLLLGVFTVALLVNRWLGTDSGRRSKERMILRLPGLGSLTSRFALSRFCRMLGTLLKAGVPLIAALNVARRSVGNQILIDAMTASIERVRQGDRLAASLSDCKQLFPPSVLEMVAIAEETGRLDRELLRVADATEGELDRRLKTAVALAEPLLLFIMAAVIGTIFIGMVIPIFTIQDYIK